MFGVLCVWYISGSVYHIVFSNVTCYFLGMSVGSVIRHYSDCSSMYMICPCSVPDSTSALEPDSVHCTQEAVGMPVGR